MVVVCIGLILARPGNTRNKNDDDGGGSSLYPLGSCEYSLPLLDIKGNGLAWTCCTANKKRWDRRHASSKQQRRESHRVSRKEKQTNETSAKGGNDDDDQDGQKTRDINVGRRKLHLGLLNVKKEFPFFLLLLLFLRKKKKRKDGNRQRKRNGFLKKCSQNIRRYERGTTFGRNDPERRDR